MVDDGLNMDTILFFDIFLVALLGPPPSGPIGSGHGPGPDAGRRRCLPPPRAPLQGIMTETPGRASSKKGIHVYTYFFLCLFVSFFLSLFLSMCCFFLYGPFVSWYVPLFGALCGSCSVQTTSLVYLTMDGRGKVLFFWSSFFVPSKVLHASGPSHAQRPPARPPEGGGYRGQRPLTVRKSCTSPWWCRSTTTPFVERVSISPWASLGRPTDCHLTSHVRAREVACHHSFRVQVRELSNFCRVFPTPEGSMGWGKPNLSLLGPV